MGEWYRMTDPAPGHVLSQRAGGGAGGGQHQQSPSQQHLYLQRPRSGGSSRGGGGGGGTGTPGSLTPRGGVGGESPPWSFRGLATGGSQGSTPRSGAGSGGGSGEGTPTHHHRHHQNAGAIVQSSPRRPSWSSATSSMSISISMHESSFNSANNAGGAMLSQHPQFGSASPAAGSIGKGLIHSFFHSFVRSFVHSFVALFESTFSHRFQLIGFYLFALVEGLTEVCMNVIFIQSGIETERWNAKANAYG